MESIIGTAGWSIPRQDAAAFPAEGTGLERYARVFGGVEINSSFYRSHRSSTWARWAASVPAGFRFAVKAPKTITHQAKLADCEALVTRFAQEIELLGETLAVVLVQLPPRLCFDAGLVDRFFGILGEKVHAAVVCEPRHASWFDEEANILLRQLRVARAAADPALDAAAAVPGGWPGLAYWRLHGSPAMYRSAYSDTQLEDYAAAIRASRDAGIPTWCIFDNTAAYAATGNALALMAGVGSPR